METGQKTIQKSSSLNKNNSNALSIQISLSGLSFCILNKKSNAIAFLKNVIFDKKLTPFETLERLTTALNTNTIFDGKFENVLLIYQNELSCFVPKPLFNEDNCADYLKFNAKILNTDFITYDEIANNNSVNVFVPYININNYIFERYGTFEYKHASTLLIQSLLKNEIHSSKDKMYVNVGNSHFELVAFKNGQLELYNTFEYQSKEDFVYFILFTIEQLQFNPETLKLKLIGDISKDDELFASVYNFIRFVDFIEPFHNYKFDEKQQPSTPYSNFIILNSFN